MPKIKRDFYTVCPFCWSVMVKHRVFKNPRYKCEKCGSEFFNKKRIGHADIILFNSLMKTARSDLEHICKTVDDIRLRKATVITLKEFFKCEK